MLLDGAVQFHLHRLCKPGWIWHANAGNDGVVRGWHHGSNLLSSLVEIVRGKILVAEIAGSLATANVPIIVVEAPVVRAEEMKKLQLCMNADNQLELITYGFQIAMCYHPFLELLEDILSAEGLNISLLLDRTARRSGSDDFVRVQIAPIQPHMLENVETWGLVANFIDLPKSFELPGGLDNGLSSLDVGPEPVDAMGEAHVRENVVRRASMEHDLQIGIPVSLITLGHEGFVVPAVEKGLNPVVESLGLIFPVSLS
jgi:hypothetical protein